MSDIWVTKDGSQIPVAEMTDSHIINAYSYFNRVPLPPAFNGEMAQFYAEIEWNNLCDTLDRRCAMLEEEAGRRGLSLT